MFEQNKLEGIGGWLILVAIGIVISPVRLFGLIITTYPPIFSDGTWQALTTQGGAAYNPLWAPIILGELFINIGLLFACLVLVYKFFSKSRDFPVWYISLSVFVLVFVLADAFLIRLVLPNEPVFAADTVKEVLRSLFSVVVWVPYMLTSIRVKDTFVN